MPVRDKTVHTPFVFFISHTRLLFGGALKRSVAVIYRIIADGIFIVRVLVWVNYLTQCH